MITMNYSPIIINTGEKWAVEAIIAYVHSLFPSKNKKILVKRAVRCLFFSVHSPSDPHCSGKEAVNLLSKRIYSLS